MLILSFRRADGSMRGKDKTGSFSQLESCTSSRKSSGDPAGLASAVFRGYAARVDMVGLFMSEPCHILRCVGRMFRKEDIHYVKRTTLSTFIASMLVSIFVRRKDAICRGPNFPPHAFSLVALSSRNGVPSQRYCEQPLCTYSKHATQVLYVHDRDACFLWLNGSLQPSG